ncbi:unnamed protein product [Sphagnum troendelagicum]|uniref:Uncharacterized protein n=2 Tax=Sphagnum TaxID=13804 RepID=A0ABP0V1Z8_9BRYO
MYDDEAGDLDRHFDALGLHLESTTEDGTQEPNDAAAETKVRPPPTTEAGTMSQVCEALIQAARRQHNTDKNDVSWSFTTTNVGAWN